LLINKPSSVSKNSPLAQKAKYVIKNYDSAEVQRILMDGRHSNDRLLPRHLFEDDRAYTAFIDLNEEIQNCGPVIASEVFFKVFLFLAGEGCL